jgi:hypothetical protein
VTYRSVASCAEVLASSARSLANAFANRRRGLLSWLRGQYWAIDPDDYGLDHGGVDPDYTVNTFTDLVDFFARAAGAGRGIAFIVDQ